MIKSCILKKNFLFNQKVKFMNKFGDFVVKFRYLFFGLFAAESNDASVTFSSLPNSFFISFASPSLTPFCNTH